MDRRTELDEESDEWIDWDEGLHCPMGTKENRKEYPNRFTWTCCESPADAEPCCVGRHVPKG
ncbi:hypothetical protein K469DRAFT_702625 [Zopfia rhizophila CBS 207.26]|uniref:Uncharacterized protein n=1 Tax=Zopfia rhizophila CBS 207.26 TaxID=1314779 RepID=A0A6A6EGD3_9PEZI|nr:hypothetical protein K469DRAFT_702625 [Zopfia rhizophila CBS 207.26]